MKPIKELSVASIQYEYGEEFERKWKSLVLALLGQQLDDYLFGEEENEIP